MITTEMTKKEMLLEGLSKLSFSNEPSFFVQLREQAKKVLNQLELPTSKTEYWKYTRLGKIINKSYTVNQNNEEIDLTAFLIPHLDANIVVLVNGFYREDLSKLEPQNGVIIQSLSKAKIENSQVLEKHFGKYAVAENEIFTALNMAHHTGGVFVYAEKNIEVEKPIHIINLVNDNGVISQKRNLIVAERSSSVKIVESFRSLNCTNSFTNNVTEVFAGENTVVEYNKIQEVEGENYQISTEQVYQEANSNFTISTVTLKGALIRNNLTIIVDAEGCETNLNGIYLPRNKDHFDNHTVVDHKKPNCNSNEVYKGVLDDESVAVFNGKVFVRPDAQKTNAFQQNNNIVLTDNAIINSKPELEIYADDVKCSHGSTTGQLDEEAIFYLRARGVGRKSAINMLVNAFTKAALERVTIEPFKILVDNKIEERFGN